MLETYPSNVCLAAVQMAPVMFDSVATAEKVCKYVDEAAAHGANVIGFPESIIPGYPMYLLFGDMLYQGKYNQKMFEEAVTMDGPVIKMLSECARRNKVYFCVSATEREKGSLYLTQFWFGPNGDLIGTHRKTKPTQCERILWGQGDGSTMNVYETEYGNLGSLQCFEHAMPTNLAAMCAQNEQIHVAAWPIAWPLVDAPFGPEQMNIVSRYYAMANQCFVIESSGVWSDDQQQAMCETDAQKAIMAMDTGVTKIINPNGVTIAEVPKDQEGICYATVDLRSTIANKITIDPAGHYAVPGVISLNFNKAKQEPVRIINENPSSTVVTYDEIQAVKGTEK